jgi:hypothetical protein
MKALNVLTAVSLLAIGSSSAFADQTFHVGGSTAFRSAVHNAIVHLLAQNGTVKVAYNGSSLAGANQAVFQGTITGLSGTTTIETAWNGSITGIAGIVEPATEKFAFLTAANIPATGFETATASSQPNNPGTTQFSGFGLTPGATASGASLPSTGNPSETVAPDLAFSDAFVSSSPFKAGFPNSSTVVDTIVGVIPFTWIKNAAQTTDADYVSGGYNRITNISSLQAKALFSEGLITGADLTDNSADQFLISLAGRDYDSGTRFDALAEAQSAGNTSITQFGDSPAGSGHFNITGSGTASVVNQTPNSNVQVTSALSTLLPATGGFNSGGKLVAGFQATGTDSAPDFGGYLVTYAGASDADTALGVTTGGPTGYVAPSALTFNGVALTKANVANGTYSFWTYEHFLTQGPLANAGTFANSLFNQLKNTDATVAGYKVSDLNSGVSRQVEGGVITLP